MPWWGVGVVVSPIFVGVVAGPLALMTAPATGLLQWADATGGEWAFSGTLFLSQFLGLVLGTLASVPLWLRLVPLVRR